VKGFSSVLGMISSICDSRVCPYGAARLHPELVHLFPHVNDESMRGTRGNPFAVAVPTIIRAWISR